MGYVSGKERDGETGFYFYRAWYYDPVKGRFLQGFDTLTGTVLVPPSPIRSSDGRTFDAFADVVYSTIPGEPCIPTNPCRLNIHGVALQPIQFTAVDRPGTSFFDIFVTTEFTARSTSPSRSSR